MEPGGRMGRLPAIDGLRGLAILLVMFFHMTLLEGGGWPERALQRLAGAGDCGVDLFFVISGFLITGILFDTRDDPQRTRKFYIRRALRILPLYYLFLTLAWFVTPLLPLGKAEKFAAFRHEAIYYWLHLSNFVIAARGHFVNGIVDISWSLAIEEQFYLVWPALVWALPRRGVGWASLVIALLSVGSRVALSATGHNPVAIYTLTPCRLDGLAMGALVAFLVREPAPERWLQASRWLGIAALTACFAALLADYRTELFRTGVALAGATVIYRLALGNPPRGIKALFESRFLASFGNYSYALYLFHYPVMAALRDLLRHGIFSGPLLVTTFVSQLGFYAAGITVSYLLAWASWWGYERHFLELKTKLA